MSEVKKQSQFAHSSSQSPHTFSPSTFIIPDKYRIIRPMGIGAYGIVVACKDTETDEKVAIKKVPDAFKHTTDMKRTLRELRILSRFNHENVISAKDIFKPKSFDEFNDVYYVTELMDTDLYQVINSPQALSDEHVQYFLYQVLRGLKYIHSADVLHRDLKPSNILLNKNCDLKICDFGLARPTNDSEKNVMTEYVATRWYRAPEIILTWKHYTKAVDMWSVGCIFAEMLSRKPLFPGKDYLHQLKLYVDLLGNFTEEDVEDIESERAKKYVLSLARTRRVPWRDYFARYHVQPSEQAINLLERMLVYNPKKRITVEEALAHPYLSQLHDEPSEPTADIIFDFSYEEFLSKENLKHLIYNEMLKFHPESAAESRYSPSPEVYAVNEIANPGLMKSVGVQPPAVIPKLTPTTGPAAAKKEEKKEERKSPQPTARTNGTGSRPSSSTAQQKPASTSSSSKSSPIRPEAKRTTRTTTTTTTAAPTATSSRTAAPTTTSSTQSGTSSRSTVPTTTASAQSTTTSSRTAAPPASAQAQTATASSTTSRKSTSKSSSQFTSPAGSRKHSPSRG
ncbi:putative Mitogen-activated protein kinase [Blattamonas nauphoetae]|uniref:Mitogen-activated protein kinase n=1 Tax=Blattamonas nauphoetae TaxID=2049346 RepID=A0ABQ9YF20_9EUKA|nr:putative Mitogen-activated protein kinase [Blattamonas nauphoetae]